MQPVDFTTLTATCADLRSHWLPARLEQVYQRDRHTVALCLRTLDRRGWLTISWHPQAARLCIDDPPPRTPDTFTFSQQLRHQLSGLALVAMEAIAPWERVFDLQFARRPGDPPQAHLYVEIMSKYSNVILTNAEHQIVTAAHQVSAQQSRVRPIQTGDLYEKPPALTDAIPSLSESQEQWRERLSVLPVPLRKALLKTYRGLSSTLVASMIEAAGLDPEQSVEHLPESAWGHLFQRWQAWLTALDTHQFAPGWLPQGYTVMGWGQGFQPVDNLQRLLCHYYNNQLNQQTFQQLKHQLQQRVTNVLAKLSVKATDFQTRLQQSDDADQLKAQADLLMAHLQHWQPGLTTIALPDFETQQPVTIALDPEKNAVQNAQGLYKRHQKLKRSRAAIDPLLQAVQLEIGYLEQTQEAIAQLDQYTTPDDLQALEEIRDELIQQGYLSDPEHRYRSASPEQTTRFRRYKTPNGLEVLIGRNNRQNDQITFRLANDYDLWFHSQEIHGSHVLLRLEPGTPPDDADLQFAADLAAYYSRGNQSEQVPVVYTTPRHLFRPKGAKPGMVIYKQERVLWGQPQRAKQYHPVSDTPAD